MIEWHVKCNIALESSCQRFRSKYLQLISIIISIFIHLIIIIISTEVSTLQLPLHHPSCHHLNLIIVLFDWKNWEIFPLDSPFEEVSQPVILSLSFDMHFFRILVFWYAFLLDSHLLICISSFFRFFSSYRPSVFSQVSLLFHPLCKNHLITNPHLITYSNLNQKNLICHPSSHWKCEIILTLDWIMIIFPYLKNGRKKCMKNWWETSCFSSSFSSVSHLYLSLSLFAVTIFCNPNHPFEIYPHPCCHQQVGNMEQESLSLKFILDPKLSDKDFR